jgi:hypothetical protein
LCRGKGRGARLGGRKREGKGREEVDVEAVAQEEEAKVFVQDDADTGILARGPGEDYAAAVDGSVSLRLGGRIIDKRKAVGHAMSSSLGWMSFVALAML